MRETSFAQGHTTVNQLCFGLGRLAPFSKPRLFISTWDWISGTNQLSESVSSTDPDITVAEVLSHDQTLGIGWFALVKM